MPLPPWNDHGLLPLGVHRAELPDLYERFVLDAPCQQHREILHGALVTHLTLIRTVIPMGTAWISGSFSTRAEEPPKDVDVVILPTDWRALLGLATEAKARLYGLLTLQQVQVAQPAVYLDRLQPVGGAVDAFLCYPGHEDVWRGRWSAVRTEPSGEATNQSKGYAEVVW